MLVSANDPGTTATLRPTKVPLPARRPADAVNLWIVAWVSTCRGAQCLVFVIFFALRQAMMRR
jgi:hypothetical protein